jgi:bacillithiol biosynthesis cysteine-adding enzyme BshC
MLKRQYSFEDLKFSSHLIRDLIDENVSVEPLVSDFFDLGRMDGVMEEKDFSADKRADLVKALNEQNRSIQLSEKSKQNLDLLVKEDTYTITTGHQLNLMTGPLFSIYKILEVISLTNELNDRYKAPHFVPIFWMATEDHDFEEINHLNLFGEKHEWTKTAQEDVIVGRLSTSSMRDFLNGLESKYQDPEAQKLVKKLISHYEDSPNLAGATRSLINELFGDYGLLILDGDDASLKKHFAWTMQREVEEELGLEAVSKTNDYLSKNGYHEQVYVRNCNLFYIQENGKRIRILKEDGAYLIGDDSYNVEEISELILDKPENFSPNALFRPVYQETILPNLAYIGGGGEISYWLQLGELFSLMEVKMPMLRVRDSILLYNKKQAELMAEHQVSLMDLRIGVDQLVKDIAINNSDMDLELTDVTNLIKDAKRRVLDKVEQVSPNLNGMVEAEFSKMIKSIDKIESKLIKAEKQKHDNVQTKLIRMRERFYPNNGFQERHENILSFIVSDPGFIQKILNELKPENKAVIRTVEI